MDLTQNLQKAINYIENNLLNTISNEIIAKRAYSSNENFQKVFKMMTGITIGEYIRNRRLSIAGQDLIGSNEKIINLAFKYGYETPESFTKAFTRFHGISPSDARKYDSNLKKFNPLSLQINNKGGFSMESGANWYAYFYDDAYGWSWSPGYRNKYHGEDGRRLTIRINPKFQDKWQGCDYPPRTTGGDENCMGIEIYTPLYKKIKTFDTVKIDNYGNIIIGGDTILNIMGTVIQEGNAEYMIGYGDIIRDAKGKIIAGELIEGLMRAEIEKYGNNSDFGDYKGYMSVGKL